MGGQRQGNFPISIPKTDETRVQSALKVLHEMSGLPYHAVLKCDGSSGTFLMHEGVFSACSRNYMLKEDQDNVFWGVARKYGLPEIMAQNSTLALQGEVVGPGIQKNRLGLQHHELRAFDLYDQSARKYLTRAELEEFCLKYSIPVAPVIEEGESFNHTLESLLALAEGKYDGTSNEREGLVVRPKNWTFSSKLRGRMSIKVISNRYLLKAE